MEITKALEVIRQKDEQLYNWIMSNGKSISNQTIILYAEKLEGK